MATAKCPECERNIGIGHAFCPHCGAAADNIRKAAAGLDALVTLGSVVHDRGGLEVDALGDMCRRFAKDYGDKDVFYHDARAGNTNAMMCIGHMYWEGGSVRKNEDEAMKWFRLALKHGDSIASETLELCEKLRGK